MITIFIYRYNFLEDFHRHDHLLIMVLFFVGPIILIIALIDFAVASGEIATAHSMISAIFQLLCHHFHSFS